MKRLAFLVVVLVAALVAAASAMAAPAPKATGGIGYSDANRSFAFNFSAIQSSDKPITVWNVEGVTSITFNYAGTDYVHTASLTQNGQSIVGSGGYAGTPANTWTVNPGSTVVGNALNLTWNYTSPDSLVSPVQNVMTMQGTINSGVISGNWSQTSGESGTFTATGATASTYTAKGLAFYSDADDYYVMVVRAVNVAGTDAWFAGEVVDTNRSDWMSDWVSFQVQDNGQGGTATTTDKLWGAFADSEAAALATVTGKAIPSTDGNPSAEYSITSGNLQVQ
jgi:hypothetical protein